MNVIKEGNFDELEQQMRDRFIEEVMGFWTCEHCTAEFQVTKDDLERVSAPQYDSYSQTFRSSCHIACPSCKNGRWVQRTYKSPNAAPSVPWWKKLIS